MRNVKQKVEQEVRRQVSDYEYMTYEEIAPVANARKDYEGYSTIKINRLDRNQKYLEIILENPERYKRLSNAAEYMVLVDRVGNLKDYYATGRLVRKDIIIDTRQAPRAVTKKAKDNNFEVL